MHYCIRPRPHPTYLICFFFLILFPITVSLIFGFILEKIMPPFTDQKHLRIHEHALLSFNHGVKYVIGYCNKVSYDKCIYVHVPLLSIYSEVPLAYVLSLIVLLYLNRAVYFSELSIFLFSMVYILSLRKLVLCFSSCRHDFFYERKHITTSANFLP
jgi:hypothetical protein